MGIRQLLLLSGVCDASVSPGGHRTTTPQYQGNLPDCLCACTSPHAFRDTNSLHSGPQWPRTVGEVVCVSQREAAAFSRVEMQREGANLGEVGNVLFLLSLWLWRFPSLRQLWKSFTQQQLRENLPESLGQGMSAASH